MISNHSQFLAAIRQQRLVRLFFYTLPDGRTMDHEYAPLGYAPSPDGKDTRDRYWFCDPFRYAGANGFGLVAEQIVTLNVLDREFDPADFPTIESTFSALPAPCPTAC